MSRTNGGSTSRNKAAVSVGIGTHTLYWVGGPLKRIHHTMFNLRNELFHIPSTHPRIFFVSFIDFRLMQVAALMAFRLDSRITGRPFGERTWIESGSGVRRAAALLRHGCCAERDGHRHADNFSPLLSQGSGPQTVSLFSF